jgi:hypothetical protein
MYRLSGHGFNAQVHRTPNHHGKGWAGGAGIGGGGAGIGGAGAGGH